MSELRKELGIDEYLNLIKENPNYDGAYISFGQYMYLLEKENEQLKEQLQHYKAQEIERINKNLLDTENNYLECCIKSNIVGDKNEC